MSASLNGFDASRLLTPPSRHTETSATVFGTAFAFHPVLKSLIAFQAESDKEAAGDRDNSLENGEKVKGEDNSAEKAEEAGDDTKRADKRKRSEGAEAQAEVSPLAPRFRFIN